MSNTDKMVFILYVASTIGVLLVLMAFVIYKIVTHERPKAKKNEPVTRTFGEKEGE